MCSHTVPQEGVYLQALSNRFETMCCTLMRRFPSLIDPMLPKPPYHNSRAMIDACRPWAWRHEFPAVAESTPELMAKTKAKWGHLLKRGA